MTFEALIKNLKSEIASAQVTVLGFSEELAKADHPSYSFEWSEQAITAAARIYVIEFALGALEGSDVRKVRELEKEVLNQILQEAGSPRRSSSALSNHTAQELNAARVTLYRMLVKTV